MKLKKSKNEISRKTINKRIDMKIDMKIKQRSKLKIGVVTSRFNSEVTDKLEEGALETLQSLGATAIEILAVRVPGAVEIPLTIQALFDSGCDGVVALGCVIRGETSHYDYVCNSVERGVTQLMLEYKRPIGFGVLTTESEEQAFDRVGGRHGHKGVEAAEVTLEMVGLLSDLRNQKKTKSSLFKAKTESPQPKRKK
jgi:6,7-dimethyl-8-ribityllumazine synthase